MYYTQYSFKLKKKLHENLIKLKYKNCYKLNKNDKCYKQKKFITFLL